MTATVLLKAISNLAHVMTLLN